MSRFQIKYFLDKKEEVVEIEAENLMDAWNLFRKSSDRKELEEFSLILSKGIIVGKETWGLFRRSFLCPKDSNHYVEIRKLDRELSILEKEVLKERAHLKETIKTLDREISLLLDQVASLMSPVPYSHRAIKRISEIEEELEFLNARKTIEEKKLNSLSYP